MRTLSLTARLTLIFTLVTTTSFALVGVLLFKAASQRIIEQDETNLVLSARHLRRLAGEFAALPDLVAHQDRLVISVLGDASNALRITGSDGQTLVDHNPLHLPLAFPDTIAPDQRLVPTMLESLRDTHGDTVRGMAAAGKLQDGTLITIIVARSLADRQLLLRHYQRDMVRRLLAGMAAAILLGYLLIRQALRPLRTLAGQAATISAHNLGTRLSASNAPPELHALTATLNDMLSRLEEGFSRVWRFTVDLAHDLRTPIGNLRGTNEVALTRPRTSEEYQALLGSNIEECDRVSRMIENVLFLARAESPQFALQRSVFDVGDELQLIGDYFEGIAADAEVDIRVAGHARLLADRDLFRRAVGNLLSNALRYTPRHHAIDVRVEEAPGAIRILVENPGDGIAPEHLDKLFDRFYRVDRARGDSAHSAGLGLSIVRSILDLHGGRVTAESEPSGTTRFTLWFPTAPP
ncbi:heavy metal sensor signal transduction histidine kinase [Dyella jiangningensis]|uniref:heavy metal sensor histidine kinase n=1 Tax=Dyella sp. AtDHG13 TaxID=1938897 RepID=UPI000888C01B|nr:heavy metal sensor histidine kinase [Dyella sp. AtDHG13]PXV55880.1 heavy metal sensor signal transduction histidine kinase [Dyella sp. AtDHG13]SDK52530.1 heavy metal sensor signal transduction histidine kinase [Dyella jiangningensis]